MTNQDEVSRKSIMDFINRAKGLRFSLRTQVALGVALPVFLILASLSFLNYSREYQLLDEQARLDAVQLGEMMIHSLNHAMLTKEGEHLMGSISDVSQLENVKQIQVVGISGKILADSSTQASNLVLSMDQVECLACHHYPGSERPRVIPMKGESRGWRISAPVNNLPECHDCHDPVLNHLGMLLMDISLTGRQAHLIGDLRLSLIITVISTALVSVLIFFLIQKLVVRRVEGLRQPLTEYANGNFSARIEQKNPVNDEISDLAATFNNMADELDRHAAEANQRQDLRERAILDERERIARELHDGFAQVLGYVNTKVMAARLLVKKKKLREADLQLAHLEKAARGLFVDVREAILGLKMAGQYQPDLIEALEGYISEFSQLSGIPTIFDLSIPQRRDGLSQENELHLFRIVQEALTNIRKHSNASQAWVKIYLHNSSQVLEISDNGIGFDPDHMEPGSSSQLGLGIMQERAIKIGAKFFINSQDGLGTRIVISLPVVKMESGE